MQAGHCGQPCPAGLCRGREALSRLPQATADRKARSGEVRGEQAAEGKDRLQYVNRMP